mgnify:CR=1 FL=1|tara:strand:+ start:205 stop:498 length:294 start_codon:yes stop_codon:yes gene_type:complete
MNWKEILKEWDSSAGNLPTEKEWDNFISGLDASAMVDLPEISYEQFIANEEEAKGFLLQMSKKEDAKVKEFWARYPNLKLQEKQTREEKYPNLKFRN